MFTLFVPVRARHDYQYCHPTRTQYDASSILSAFALGSMRLQLKFHGMRGRSSVVSHQSYLIVVDSRVDRRLSQAMSAVCLLHDFISAYKFEPCRAQYITTARHTFIGSARPMPCAPGFDSLFSGNLFISSRHTAQWSTRKSSLGFYSAKLRLHCGMSSYCFHASSIIIYIIVVDDSSFSSV